MEWVVTVMEKSNEAMDPLWEEFDEDRMGPIFIERDGKPPFVLGHMRFRFMQVSLAERKEEEK